MSHWLTHYFLVHLKRHMGESSVDSPCDIASGTLSSLKNNQAKIHFKLWFCCQNHLVIYKVKGDGPEHILTWEVTPTRWPLSQIYKLTKKPICLSTDCRWILGMYSNGWSYFTVSNAGSTWHPHVEESFIGFYSEHPVLYSILSLEARTEEPNFCLPS